MKLGKFILTDWERSYGGWFKYDTNYLKEGTFAIALYHNLAESFENANLQLPANSVYDPESPILWTVYSEPNWFSDIYYRLYEPRPITAEHMKIVIDNLIIRIDKLIIFS
jgi:hypothetical protein